MTLEKIVNTVQYGAKFKIHTVSGNGRPYPLMRLFLEANSHLVRDSDLKAVREFLGLNGTSPMLVLGKKNAFKLLRKVLPHLRGRTKRKARIFLEALQTPLIAEVWCYRYQLRKIQRGDYVVKKV